ncbi:hypothetical protein FRC02_001292 [Tulasnella sp. 418]|nr:hypothetical protein FRC02_001292 [Tulasnella sp. 418]
MDRKLTSLTTVWPSSWFYNFDMPVLSTRALLLFQIIPILASGPRFALPHLCRYGESCWPRASVWQQFNASIDGQLVAVLPPAAPCHKPNYDEAACLTIRKNWTNSFWRADQVGAYQVPYWERGLNGTCFIGTPVEQISVCQKAQVICRCEKYRA